MLSHGMYNGIWKIEKSPCRSGKDSLLVVIGGGNKYTHHTL